MGFGDTLKDILDQGLQVSKDFAAKAGEKAQVWGEKGLAASKEFAAKAGAKVQEMGEKGVLLLEIKQLESQERKLAASIGAEVFSLYEDGKAPSIEAEDGTLKTLLGQMAQIKEEIEKREAEIKEK